ncbi:unnamed protein product [Clonostachys rhizophaga]|uniref:25S rRNA (uridine-N(3))-methyltransferase BMT5-like domain-containing protein n=1 Tax=Clonostachys rhizophaga TaxID=160324 RepID=A0A9N9VH02_9HYPO|nr:unnamed protein product [Clonostachys rhizophaga]
MGGKRRRLAQKGQANVKRLQKDQPGQGRAAASDAAAGQPKSKKGPNPAHQQKQHEKPTIPFNPEDRILLIGEGDLSFAASLATHHRCTNLVATVLEKSAQELTEKYPHAAENMTAVTSPPPPPPQSDDDEEGEENDDAEESDHLAATSRDAAPTTKNRIVYGLDATRPLPSSASRPPPTRILFNFPHVGGKSTDVNRQVRHNQSLLVSFFDHALRALAPGGTIVVTLFEGEPYTLWNVRDLARHAGLQVDRSFRFQAAAYPGYRHARTLGVVKARSGEDGGGWKGEERAARSYVFVRKGDTPLPFGASRVNTSKKRRRGQDEDDSDEDF